MTQTTPTPPPDPGAMLAQARSELAQMRREMEMLRDAIQQRVGMIYALEQVVGREDAQADAPAQASEKI